MPRSAALFFSIGEKFGLADAKTVFAEVKRPRGASVHIDLKFCGIGSSLFLAVFNTGGQFFTGDGHAVQGDGEVDGGAIEISLKPTLQFILHKDKAIKLPRVETATDYLTTGLDVDL